MLLMILQVDLDGPAEDDGEWHPFRMPVASRRAQSCPPRIATRVLQIGNLYERSEYKQLRGAPQLVSQFIWLQMIMQPTKCAL